MSRAAGASAPVHELSARATSPFVELLQLAEMAHLAPEHNPEHTPAAGIIAGQTWSAHSGQTVTLIRGQ